MSSPDESFSYEVDGLRIDAAQRVVLAADGSRVALSSRAFTLLLFFLEHPGELLDKHRLMKAVWPNSVVEENNLNQCIGVLRRVLGETPGQHRYLVTETGRGYRFVAEVRRVARAPAASAPLPSPTSAAAPADLSPRASRAAPRRFAIGAAAVVAAGFVLWLGLEAERSPPAVPVDRSIAVLQFDNLSELPENAYLARGIQAEILTLLSRVHELRVVSRNSTEKYASSNAAVGKIARDLNVAHVLQGSVQRSGDRVRVNVQLVDAAADRHDWAETYERALADVFALESEVAQDVARQLQATLTSEERAEFTGAPTRVPAAYDAYLRARSYAERSTRTEPEIRDAIAAYEQAVRLDPTFATAWAQLSRRHANLFSLSYDRSVTRRDLANAALQEALRLAPDRTETSLAQAYFLFRVEHDFDAAERIMRAVAAESPGNPDPAGGLAQLARERGQMQESLDRSRDSLRDDPQNPYLHAITCHDFMTGRQFDLAIKTCERALDLLPNDVGALVIESSTYQALGRTDRAGAMLGKVRAAPSDWRTLRALAYQAALTRQPAAAIDLLQTHLANADALGSRRGAIRRSLADLQRLAGDNAAAAASYEQARAELQTELAKQPANATVVAELAVVNAELGNGPVAADQANRCGELATQAGRDSLAEECARARARVAMTSGDRNSALAALRKVLITTGGDPPLTAALLAIDPTWDPLRDAPEFAALSATDTAPAR